MGSLVRVHEAANDYAVGAGSAGAMICTVAPGVGLEAHGRVRRHAPNMLDVR